MPSVGQGDPESPATDIVGSSWLSLSQCNVIGACLLCADQKQSEDKASLVPVFKILAQKGPEMYHQ